MTFSMPGWWNGKGQIHRCPAAQIVTDLQDEQGMDVEVAGL